MEEDKNIPDGMQVPVGADTNLVTDGLVMSGEVQPRKNKSKIVGLTLIFAALAIVLAGGVVWGLKYFSDRQQKNNCETNSSDTNCQESGTSGSSGSSSSSTTTGEATIKDANGNVITLHSGTVTATIGGKSITYNGAYVIDGTEIIIENGEFASTSDDQNTFLVINGGKLTLNNVTVSKSGSENFQGRGDNYSFYGTNSAIVVVGEDSTLTMNGGTISTTVSGANAVVATNKGKATVDKVTVATTKDNSRGMHATYEGEITISNSEISTLGDSCASLATDRGAGVVTASNMKLSTAGSGSPLIYSTGTISVSDSTGTSTGAPIAVVEGKNSITVKNSQFSANGIGNRNNVDNAGVMIYQSMSGDASVGTGNFTAENSTFTVLDTSSVYKTTPFFFITNTDAVIKLSNVTANFSPDQPFISAKGTSEWGRSGSNGGKVTYTGTSVTATNTTVSADSVSSVSGL